MYHKIDWVKYVVVFVITAFLFATASYVSNYFTNRKLDSVKSVQDKVFIDLLSSETQFSLLTQTACENVSQSSLSKELNGLAEKISYSEQNFNMPAADLQNLKRYYSLLEIRDYLLMQQISQRCNMKSVFILYFYKNDKCDDCVKEWYVLGTLKDKYPALRVYSFDYDLDLSAIASLKTLYKIPADMPALYMNGKVYTGFQSAEDIEKALPELPTTLEVDETTNASSTPSRDTTKPATKPTVKATTKTSKVKSVTE